MTLLLQDTLVISPKTKQQVEKNTSAIAELQEKSAIAYHFKGSKPTFNDLPTTGNEVGDVWDVQDTGANYGWTGTEWDALGPIADLEPYLTKEDAASIYSTKTETDALLVTKQDTLTESQLAAVNSGVTADSLQTLETDIMNNKSEIANLKVSKQDTLTVGENITISEDNVISATGVSALSELEDVTITTPTNGQGLVYNGEKWENKKVIVNTGTFSSTTQESIGFGINSVSSNQDSISIGNNSISDRDGAIAIGRETAAQGNRVVVIGGNASATSDAGNGIAIGTHAEISGAGAGYQIAIGAFSAASAERSIQLGGLGTNNEAYSFKVGFSSSKNYKLLDGNTGNIPAERLAEIMIVSDTAPTTTTAGALGDLYKDTTTGLIYRCKAVDTTLPSYEWEELGSKASGNFYRSLSNEQKSILQTTGLYEDQPVESGEIFTAENGTFVQYITDEESGSLVRTIKPLSYTIEQIDQLLNQAYVTTSWTIPLPVADWVENKQIFTIQGLTADSGVDLNPVVPTTREEMIKLSNAGLFISALGENSVTIECMNLPTEDLVVKLKREMTTNVALEKISAQLTEINGV